MGVIVQEGKEEVLKLVFIYKNDRKMLSVTIPLNIGIEVQSLFSESLPFCQVFVMHKQEQ